MVHSKEEDSVLAAEHAADERLAGELATQATTLLPPEIAAQLPPLYSQEEQGIRILDHIVIGKGRYVSFVDDGYW